MGERASVSGYSNEREKGMLHSMEPSCIMGVITVPMESNAFAA